MLCHGLAIVTWFIGPLIVWLMKRDSSPYIDDQGKEALNFQITITIFYLAAGVLTCVSFFALSFLPVAVILVNLIFCIMAMVGASSGQVYRYPVSLRIIR